MKVLGTPEYQPSLQVCHIILFQMQKKIRNFSSAILITENCL